MYKAKQWLPLLQRLYGEEKDSHAIGMAEARVCLASGDYTATTFLRWREYPEFLPHFHLYLRPDDHRAAEEER